MIIFDIAAGILFGILAGMGIGGGGLLVIYLTLIRDYAQIDAQTTNLLFFVFAAFAAMAVHLRKRKIDFILVSSLAISGIVGSLVGSHVAILIPQTITRKLFGAMLIASGVITAIRIFLQSKSAKDKVKSANDE